MKCYVIYFMSCRTLSRVTLDKEVAEEYCERKGDNYFFVEEEILE